MHKKKPVGFNKKKNRNQRRSPRWVESIDEIKWTVIQWNSVFSSSRKCIRALNRHISVSLIKFRLKSRSIERWHMTKERSKRNIIKLMICYLDIVEFVPDQMLRHHELTYLFELSRKGNKKEGDLIRLWRIFTRSLHRIVVVQREKWRHFSWRVSPIILFNCSHNERLS